VRNCPSETAAELKPASSSKSLVRWRKTAASALARALYAPCSCTKMDVAAVMSGRKPLRGGRPFSSMNSPTALTASESRRCGSVMARGPKHRSARPLTEVPKRLRGSTVSLRKSCRHGLQHPFQVIHVGLLKCLPGVLLGLFNVFVGVLVFRRCICHTLHMDTMLCRWLSCV